MFRALFGSRETCIEEHHGDQGNADSSKGGSNFENESIGAYKWIKMANSDQPLMEVEKAVADKVLKPLGEETNVNLISIFGAARQGKSFLMNLLAGKQGLFRISNNQDPCTQGIDLSGSLVSLQQFATVDSPGCTQSVAHEMKIGFVDAEGQGDRDTEYDARLVSPALLASKCVIFNWKDSLQRDRILNLLGVISRAALNVESGRREGAGNGDIMDCNDAESHVFGHLHIVFRDWAYEGSKEKVYSSIFKDERSQTPDAAFRNQLRRNLIDAFRSITIWLLPPPTDNTADLKEKLSLNVLNRGFRDEVGKLREKLAEQLQEPTLFNGKPITGPFLAKLIPTLVDVLNSGSTILPESAYLTMLNAEIVDIRRKYSEYLGLVAEEYKESLKENAKDKGALLNELNSQFNELLQDYLKDAQKIGASGEKIESEAEELKTLSKSTIDSIVAVNETFLSTHFKQACKEAWNSFDLGLKEKVEISLPMDPKTLESKANGLKQESMASLQKAPRGDACDLDLAMEHLNTKADLAITKLSSQNQTMIKQSVENQAKALEEAIHEFDNVFIKDIKIARKHNEWGPDLLKALYEGHTESLVERLEVKIGALIASTPQGQTLLGKFREHTKAMYQDQRVRLAEEGARALLDHASQAKKILQDQVMQRLYPMLPLEDKDLESAFNTILDKILEDVEENLSEYSIDQGSKQKCLETIRDDSNLLKDACKDKNVVAKTKSALSEANQKVQHMTELKENANAKLAEAEENQERQRIMFEQKQKALQQKAENEIAERERLALAKQKRLQEMYDQEVAQKEVELLKAKKQLEGTKLKIQQQEMETNRKLSEKDKIAIQSENAIREKYEKEVAAKEKELAKLKEETEAKIKAQGEALAKQEIEKKEQQQDMELVDDSGDEGYHSACSLDDFKDDKEPVSTRTANLNRRKSPKRRESILDEARRIARGSLERRISEKLDKLDTLTPQKQPAADAETPLKSDEEYVYMTHGSTQTSTTKRKRPGSEANAASTDTEEKVSTTQTEDLPEKKRTKLSAVEAGREKARKFHEEQQKKASANEQKVKKDKLKASREKAQVHMQQSKKTRSKGSTAKSAPPEKSTKKESVVEKAKREAKERMQSGALARASTLEASKSKNSPLSKSSSTKKTSRKRK